MEEFEIKGHTLEYLDEIHQYLVDGICVPSITQILKMKFGNKYDGISKEVLDKASIKGTLVHKSIEDYEVYGIEDKSVEELRNYKFLKRQYKFECLKNEVPVILFIDDEPVCAGRLDLVLKENEQIGLGDIKRTSVLDKEYLAYQLNLYKIAYEQCYGEKVEFLRALHLREKTRKYVTIPIAEEPLKLVKEYLNNMKVEKVGE